MVFLVGGCHGFVCYACRLCWFGSMTDLLQLFVFCWFVLGCDCLVGCVLQLLLCLCWFSCVAGLWVDCCLFGFSFAVVYVGVFVVWL